MKKIFIASTLSLVILLAGCSSSKPIAQVTVPKPVTPAVTQASNSTSTAKVFTLTDLKKYNGKNGSSAYIAVDGIVYDVSNVRQWANGNHEMGLTAGNDLSNYIGQSPHGRSVLKGLPIVGSLK